MEGKRHTFGTSGIAPSVAVGAAQNSAEYELLQERSLLEVLNRTGAALSSELDLDRLVQIVTDAGVQLVGAQFGAFFYTKTDERGDKLLLYALSGAPREAFDKFSTPRRTAIFSSTFNGECVVRSDDITQDPRYGHNAPYHGMPAGHLPVRSYLAVPVVSRSSTVLGGLFFGHPQPGVFTARAERVIVAIAAQAAIAVDNAQLLQAVKYSEHRFRALIEHSSDGITVVDGNNKYIYVSPAVELIDGYSADELDGLSAEVHCHPDDLQRLRKSIADAIDQPAVSVPLRWRRRHKQGHWLWLEGVVTSLLHDLAVRGIVTNYRDVTSRMRAEELQQRSQKMEALGTLAGGIAHDFNNILLSIRGNTDLAMSDLANDHAAQESLREIAKAGQRAADLVRRILTFSRQQEANREVTLLQNIIGEALGLLRATMPQSIEIRSDYAADVPAVAVDATQIHQVMMNLLTNSAYALRGHSGTITVTAEAVTLPRHDIVIPRELPAGRYARVTVTDTGCGMDQAVLERIFDPFFTTKPVGEGTGLGLSVTDGIMKSHEGATTVHSRPGEGTTFQLYFPAATSRVAPTANAIPSAARRSAGERVLYVDDDEAIVNLISRSLQRLGYEVNGFTHPQKALQAMQQMPQDFDVVVTDLSMPGMSGFDLAAAVRDFRPDIPVFITSGYFQKEDRNKARQQRVQGLIPKPNAVEELAKALDRLFRGLRPHA